MWCLRKKRKEKKFLALCWPSVFRAAALEGQGGPYLHSWLYCRGRTAPSRVKLISGQAVRPPESQGNRRPLWLKGGGVATMLTSDRPKDGGIYVPFHPATNGTQNQHARCHTGRN